MTRPPEGISEDDWTEATEQASRDRHRLAALVRSGRVQRDRNARHALSLPLPPRNPTIRTNKKKRKKR